MLTPMDIHNKEFSRSLRGYDYDEVDTFLDEIVNDFEALIRERNDLRDTIDRLQSELEHAGSRPAAEPGLTLPVNADAQAEIEKYKFELENYKKLESSLKETLYLAQNKASEIISSAEKQASEVTDSARNKADELLSGVRGQVDEVIARAKKAAETIVAGANEEAAKETADARAEAASTRQAAEEFSRKAKEEAEKCLADAKEEAEKLRVNAQIAVRQYEEDQKKLVVSSRNFIVNVREMLSAQLAILDGADAKSIISEADDIVPPSFSDAIDADNDK